MTTTPNLDRSRTEFELGESEGLRLGRSESPLPPLRGGAYAVGLLFGYRSAIRRAAGEVTAHTASTADLGNSL